MDISLTIDTAQFTAAMQTLADRDLRIAGVWALNDMAEEIRQDVADRMNVVFDRPTPWTRNAFMVWRATQQTMTATVQLRPSAGSRHYLRVQEEGGPRPQTGLEQALSVALAVDGDVRSVIPGEFAKLDAYGNWSRGERNQVMSQLKVQRDAAANETIASRKRAPRRSRYFVASKGLAPGVYRRDEVGGAALRVLKISAKVPVYQQRLGFYDEAQRLFEARMTDHLTRTIGQMIAKRFG